MCKCIEETEVQLREKLADGLSGIKPSKDASLQSLFAANSAFAFMAGKNILNIPFTATWTMQSGKTKETTINMIASHCPFCGESFDEEPKERKA